jgi:uncharacterized repeat protein (TIGR01451 family)
MKKIFLLFIIVNCFSNLKAQYVTIPDPNFVSWLQANVPSAMNGNQMDTTSLAVTTRTIVDVYYKFISDLDGIQYFKALEYLDCSTNNLTSLNNLPNNLMYLNCDYNYITNISLLPNSLETLICSNNKLTSLPILPNTLKILVCNVTFSPFLASLPNLPANLDSLEINGHNLSSLPTLPLGLKKLSYRGNYVTSFPTLPPTLLYLNCSVNHITGVTPIFPSTLIKLDCSSNFITSFSQLPSNLNELNCGVNNLTNFPTLPNSLKFLDFQMNHVTSLPNLPNNLEYLIGWGNQLTSLPLLPYNLKNLNVNTNNISTLPILPPSLSRLEISYNQITSLPQIPLSVGLLSASHNLLDSVPILPNSISILDLSYNNISQITSLPINLISLGCSHNQLAQLPAIPNSVTIMDCSFNQLIQLPNIPPFLTNLACNNNSITCLQSLPSSINTINILNNSFTCLPNYLPYMNSATLAFPLCTSTNTITNPNNCNSFEGIEGFTFNDIDSNCIKGFNQGLINIPVKLYDSANNLLGQTISFGSGNYNFALPTGNYNVIIDTMYRPYSIICNNPGIDTLINLTPVNKRVSNVNFPINCKLGFDIGIQSIVTNGLVFPGQTHTLTVMAGDIYRWYNMNCAYGISGTLTFTVNGPVTYVGPSVGTLTPSVTGNIFTYNISNFSTLNNSASFQLVFQTDTTAQAGDVICLNANITPTVGDNDINNNTYQDCYNVINSYDPNIKEVYPVDVPPGFNDWLTYTIHFQNTGNAPALNIRLLDTLDNMLNLETFQVTNYSHYNQISLTGNILNVSFPNIQLPDSSSNPSGSIGFIEYRIKPKSTWAAPYKIKNTANIYFDYNAPIVTNTTYNSIVIDIGIRELYEKSTVIYPNPNNGTFTLELNNKEKVSIQLIDITGNIVLSQTIENGKGTIDASHLAAGVYNVSIKGTATVINKKMVIVK